MKYREKTASSRLYLGFIILTGWLGFIGVTMDNPKIEGNVALEIPFTIIVLTTALWIIISLPVFLCGLVEEAKEAVSDIAGWVKKQ